MRPAPAPVEGTVWRKRPLRQRIAYRLRGIRANPYLQFCTSGPECKCCLPKDPG